MNQQEFEQAVERLKAVNAVIKDLDPILRDQAVTLLKPYITGGRVVVEDDSIAGKAGGGLDRADGATPRKPGGGPTLDIDALVEEYGSDTEATNAHLALAVYYARYGKGPLNPNKSLKPIGDEMGLDLPSRVDATFARLKHDGNIVLRKGADGHKVTPSGERFLREKFGVTRGRGTPDA